MSTDQSLSESNSFPTNSEENTHDDCMSPHSDLHACTDRKLEPYIGLEFEDLEQVYDFYNSYGRNLGFGIRKNSSIRCQLTKELKWKNYVCDKAGLKGVAKDESTSQKRRRDTRTDCKAKMGVRKTKSGIWVVNSFTKEHNHMLDTPRRTKRHRSHYVAHKSKEVKAAMDQLYDAGVRPCNIARMLNVSEASNAITPQNVIDHLRIQRKNNIGREGVVVAEYLQRQLMNNSNFFFSLELDTTGLLRSIFWADSRARNDYLTFGDVLVFDVTYKTNKYLMPFAPFTGVNHHRQSILFGCALLADETEESFIWLFEQWLKCMFNQPPKTIITDMDHAICNAIKVVFPTTTHRFCSWHINKHLVENISEMRDARSGFSKDYWNWYYSRTIILSEENWKLLMEKYNLQNNKWMVKMWELRNHWVPAFLKNHFVAGMTTTGRSESMNSFFDGFVNSNTHLDEFVRQYEHALESRRLAEEVEDFKTMNSAANLISKTTIEAHAGERYTKSMFKLFQAEFKQALECWHERKNSEDKVKTYLVGLSWEDKHNWFNVFLDESNPTNITCDCCKFETDGLVCKHILHIMCKKHCTRLPEKFILKRWTIDARHTIQYGSSGSKASTSQPVTPIMKWSLTTLFNQLMEKLSHSENDFRDFYEIIKEKLVSYDGCNVDANVDIVGSQIDSNILSANIPSIHIRDPLLVRRKGRPRIASRLSSGIEVSQVNSKKRTCGLCGEKGHYSTTCPKSKGKMIHNED